MAQPAVADVRVSCPACGGPIHPIAGRCKHCRADLVAARGGATGAQGTMIQIGQLGRAGMPAAPSPVVPAHAAPVPMPARGLPIAGPAPTPPVAFAPPTMPARRPGHFGKRWPLYVAGAAAIAIIASLAILMLGGDGKQPRKRRALGPAPDRMSTDQLPTDPWARGGAPVDPSGQLLPGARVPDLDHDDTDPPAPEEDEALGGVVGGVPGGVAPAAGSADGFLREAVEVTCKRLEACWGDTTAAPMCEQGRSMLRNQGSAVVDTLCPTFDSVAAGQCLAQLASLPCPDQAATLADLTSMAYGLDPCMQACDR